MGKTTVSAFHAHYDGERIQLDEPFPLTANTPVLIVPEAAETAFVREFLAFSPAIRRKIVRLTRQLTRQRPPKAATKRKAQPWWEAMRESIALFPPDYMEVMSDYVTKRHEMTFETREEMFE